VSKTPTYDLVVLGLGAMGAMTCWRAAGRGAKVLGIEQFGPAHDRGSSHGGSRIFRKTLFEGPAYIPLIDRAELLWNQLAAESGKRLFQRSGGLCIGPRDGELIADAMRCAELGGLEYELLEPDVLAHRYPQHAHEPDDVAVLEPGAGVLNPEECIQAALDLAATAGADLRFDIAVTALQPEPDAVEVRVGGETVRARRAVLATGAWFTDLVPDLKLPLRVQRSVLTWFQGEDRDAYRPDRFPTFIRESGEMDGWGIPDVDGAGVKIGAGPSAPKPWLGHARDNDYPVDARDTRPVEQFCKLAFPGLVPIAVAARPCMNSKSPDGNFVIGPVEATPSLVLAGGFSGHGFKHASAIGDVAAQLALDGGSDLPLTAFSPERFEKGGE
jgi:sarcosine oxidase